MATTTKAADAKGRVSLGLEFARETLIVERPDRNTIVLRRGVTVPAGEAWLFRSKKALDLVQRGLESAKAGRFAKDPRLKKGRARIKDSPDGV